MVMVIREEIYGYYVHIYPALRSIFAQNLYLFSCKATEFKKLKIIEHQLF